MKDKQLQIRISQELKEAYQKKIDLLNPTGGSMSQTTITLIKAFIEKDSEEIKKFLK